MAEAGKEHDDFPKSLDDLGKAGIRLVVADSNDPDGIGFVQWRVSFYVAGEDGSLLNFFNLWDDFLIFKSKAMAKDIEAHLWPHSGIGDLEQAKINDLNYEHYTVHEPAQESELPLKWHEAAPVIGKRVATCHLTAASDTQLKLIWSGNTWAFRDAMDEAGIKGAAMRASMQRATVYVYVCLRVCARWIVSCLRVAPFHTHTVPGFYHSGEDDKETEGKRTYYRVFEVDCSEDGAADTLRDDIFDKVFHNAATRVVAEAPFEEGSDVADLVAKLRELPNLHFSK